MLRQDKTFSSGFVATTLFHFSETHPSKVLLLSATAFQSALETSFKGAFWVEPNFEKNPCCGEKELHGPNMAANTLGFFSGVRGLGLTCPICF